MEKNNFFMKDGKLKRMENKFSFFLKDGEKSS
jgi:hypothetical protein